VSRLTPGRQGIELALGDLEAAVMRAIWNAQGPVVVEDVRKALEAQGRQVAYTTVMTTMARLASKGLLRRSKRGKAYEYVPAMTEEEFGQSVARAAIEGVVSSFTQPAVAFFVEALERRDPRQLDLLAKLIEEARRKREQG
ncbi:MAG: BlaI/MecI/CopY family transcriptional regulator, partial [Armatimonadetes bacterium]|nr:BlaI/MecI/CopY family transcriptional regulator [Armatimonadota bacterium]